MSHGITFYIVFHLKEGDIFFIGSMEMEWEGGGGWILWKAMAGSLCKCGLYSKLLGNQ